MPKPAKRQTALFDRTNAALLQKRAELVLSNLGYDPREPGMLRASILDGGASVFGSALAPSPESALALINASPYVTEPLGAEQIYLHTREVASTRYIADRFAFLGANTVANIAEDCKRGISFMTRHATPGYFNPGENAYGRTFSGQAEQIGDITRVIAQFYMLRAYTPNGSAAASTDDIDRGLRGGTLFDFSSGLTNGGGRALRLCDVCGAEIFSLQCAHCPGTHFGMTDDEIAAQTARGVPSGKASFTFDDWHAGEVSIVFDGAIPFAGVAFSARGTAPRPPAPDLADATANACPCCADDSDCGCASKDGGECTCGEGCTNCQDSDCGGNTAMSNHQEEPMFTTDLKLSLGLEATATDVQVTARIAENQAKLSAATAQNETLLAAQRSAADTAFTTKWTEQLGAELVAAYLPMPNREDLATKSAAKIALASTPAPVPPPIGDPLHGTGLAAAPVTRQAGAESAESATFRTKFGRFKTAEEMRPLLSLSPIAALEKWLSTSGTNITFVREPFHEQFERQVVDRRLSVLGLK